MIPRKWPIKSESPPLILLGGEANALSIARSLTRDGVAVYMIGGHHPAHYSRAIRPIAMPRDAGGSSSAEYLLGPASDQLRGAVLLAGNDAGLHFLANNRVELSERFLLDDSKPDAQVCMLDKLCTYEAARSAGVPTPKFWPVGSATELEAIRADLVYPLIVKPKLSHVFRAKFGTKYFQADSFDEACAGVRAASDAGVDVLLMELIPGPDDRLCSYYTYIDMDGQPTFHFTKRVIRRYPVNMGQGTYHVTANIPELRPLANALFRQAGLRGLANAEFKLDVRDSTLKLIECNARFTAANQLLAVAGLDLGRWVYYRIIGRPLPIPKGFRTGVHLWSPARDTAAFLQLRRRGEITTRAWIASLLHHQSFAWFDWRDPLPSAVNHWHQLEGIVRKLARG